MKFDYLIIGAGSAGCILANRLSESSNNTVALFEVGKPSDIWESQNAACPTLYHARSKI